MNRFDRITSILVQLQSKRLITAREIADRFGVSLRTIYRDIHSLRNAGVPIGEEEGKGYFMVEGYRLPPIMFSMKEAAALATVERMLGVQGESTLKTHYESALLKIKAVLGSEEKEILYDLAARIGIYDSWSPPSNNLDIIQHSVATNRALDIEYRAKRDPASTKRRILPFALYFSGKAWSVIGHCKLREAIREFRTDRILHLSQTSETFSPDPQFSIDAYLAERAQKNFNTPDNGLSSPTI